MQRRPFARRDTQVNVGPVGNARFRTKICAQNNIQRGRGSGIRCYGGPYGNYFPLIYFALRQRQHNGIVIGGKLYTDKARIVRDGYGQRRWFTQNIVHAKRIHNVHVLRVHVQADDAARWPYQRGRAALRAYHCRHVRATYLRDFYNFTQQRVCLGRYGQIHGRVCAHAGRV